MSKSKQVRKVPKKRNPEKVVMDRHYPPKVYRSRKRSLGAKEAEQEIKDYMRGLS